MSGLHRLFFVLVIGASVLVGACGSSSSSPMTPSGPTTAVTIPQNASTMTVTAYNPNPVNVTVGTTIRWSNADSIVHTATADGGSFNSGNINGGGSFNFTFPTAGTFTYHCTIHPNMVGTVVVQ
jgi:plastocyanin